jgi:hypothetical protein
MADHIPPSLEELLLGADNVLFVGAGATDVANGIPLANHAERIGVRPDAIHFGALACQWWASSMAAPDFYPVAALKPSDQLGDGAALVTPETTVVRDRTEHVPPEVTLRETFGYPSAVLDGRGGVVGLAAALQRCVSAFDVDLIVNVDCGSDSLFDGTRGAVETPLHDFLLMAAIDSLDTTAVHTLTGYGLDGEMPMDALDATVADLMMAGAYLGAHGITQADVADLNDAYERIDDPINSLVVPAATGDHATREVFGRRITPTPLSAAILIFDLAAVVANGPAESLAATESLHEAEERLLEAGIDPETRL